MQQHPIQIIQQRSQHAGVPPAVMLAFILDPLQQRHTMTSMQRQLPGLPGDLPNVVSAVASDMQLMNQKEWPMSLLAALDTSLQIQWMLDASNAKNAAEKNRPADAAGLSGRAKAVEALRLIIRDVMNQGETTSLQYAMNVEKMFKE